METVIPVNNIRTQAVLLTANRTVINTSFRMVYPLMPVLARGVGVEIGAIATVLTVTQLLGLAAPVMGEVAERRSKRFNMVLGVAFNLLGYISVFLIPGFAGLATALILGAFGKVTLFDPAAAAYIGDRVPYQQRGVIMALMELSWSLAFLIGVPAMTFLINAYDWRAPFAVLAIFAVIGLMLTLNMIDEDESASKTGQPMLRNIRTSLASPAARAGLVMGFGISAANQLISTVFGTWIEVSFGQVLSALAAAAAVIGISELLGEGAVAGLADRFGKRRMVAVGIIVNTAACLVLPFTAFNLIAALGLLFVFFLGFEISLVASIPLGSELAPTTRGMYMTLLVASFTLGRALITFPSTLLFEAYGLLANCLLAIVLNLMALAAVVWGIRIQKPKPQV